MAHGSHSVCKMDTGYNSLIFVCVHVSFPSKFRIISRSLSSLELTELLYENHTAKNNGLIDARVKLWFYRWKNSPMTHRDTAVLYTNEPGSRLVMFSILFTRLVVLYHSSISTYEPSRQLSYDSSCDSNYYIICDNTLC